MTMAGRIRPLVRRDLHDVVRIDAIHTRAEQRPYWTRLFREFLRHELRLSDPAAAT